MSSNFESPARSGLSCVSMTRTGFSVLLLSALLSACGTSASTAHAPVPNRFDVNGATVLVPPDRLKQIGEAWHPGADALAATSGADKVYLTWILNMIAVSDASGPWPCRNLQFVRIESLPLKSMTYTSADATVTITPVRFNENWLVDACGTPQHWRVMDDSSEPLASGKNLSVMLLGGTLRAHKEQ